MQGHSPKFDNGRITHSQLGGRLLVLEGPDGVGKTTLARALSEGLAERGLNAKLFSFPGNEAGTIGAFVYDLHHDAKAGRLGRIDHAALQMLHIAAHLDTIRNRILPALQDGQYVVLDRYWWSTVVYGLCSGVDAPLLKKMIGIEKCIWGGVLPNHAFLLSRRASAKEHVPKTEFEALTKTYRTLAMRERRRYPVAVVDTETSVEQSLRCILNALHLCVETTTDPGEAPLTPSLFARTEFPTRIGFGHPTYCGTPRATMQTVAVFRATPSPIPTAVYDTYWKFAAERQAIFFRRFSGSLPPWTKDPILQAHKFTNCYRASDRVSQYLIKEVIYHGDQTPNELFFRILLYKLFNKIETWELLVRELGHVCYAEYSFREYDRVLTQAFEAGNRIYSGAYIMPSGGRASETTRKHQAHLHLLESMMQDKVPLRLAESRTMQDAFKVLRSYPMVGDFLAYQYVTDINYSQLTSFSEMEFVVPGPGARSGIKKCFESLAGHTESDIIKLVAESQETEFERLNVDFKSLWGRPLQLVDCQNLFCEVDKYARVKHPESKGIADRNRIKQRFHPNLRPIRYWFPPRWGLNDIIESSTVAGVTDANLRR